MPSVCHCRCLRQWMMTNTMADVAMWHAHIDNVTMHCLCLVVVGELRALLPCIAILDAIAALP